MYWYSYSWLKIIIKIEIIKAKYNKVVAIEPYYRDDYTFQATVSKGDTSEIATVSIIIVGNKKIDNKKLPTELEGLIPSAKLSIIS